MLLLPVIEVQIARVEQVKDCARVDSSNGPICQGRNDIVAVLRLLSSRIGGECAQVVFGPFEILLLCFVPRDGWAGDELSVAGSRKVNEGAGQTEIRMIRISVPWFQL